MFESLKVWKLTSALKSRDAEEAYCAVSELGKIGTPAAVDALVGVLARHDGVTRAAARELGRCGDARAVSPLVALLARRDVNDAAVEALMAIGPKALDDLLPALDSNDPLVRYQAARALGGMNDPRSVDRLVRILQEDDEYSVRTSAATALGQLRDSRAVWVLVGTLKLRDETSPDRRAALEALREAASRALKKIGDPLAAGKGSAVTGTAALVDRLEGGLTGAEIHPRLVGDLKVLTDADLVGVMRELVAASEEVSWSKLESRPPLLPAYFHTYEQRRQTAECIGRELVRRGGEGKLRSALDQLQQYPAIQNWWASLDQLGS